MTSKKERSEAAAVLGRVGGKARAKVLTQEQRSAIARKGAKTRWGAKRKKRAKKELDAKQGAADTVGEAASVKVA